MSGNNDFAPDLKINGCFIVRNITPDRGKTIKIFNYPIPFNHTRDLLNIPGVSESDIRASLLKGTLRHKILVKDIVVECSDIDLLQFNSAHKEFLQSAGIVNGLDVSGSAMPFVLKQNIPLIGIVNSSNKIFYTTDKFMDGVFAGNEFHIQVLHNNIILAQNKDFTISESGGSGTGFDTITIISFTPITGSFLSASYVVRTI